MKSPKSLLFLFLSTITFASLGQGVPSLINYQGRLTDQNGAPLPSGPYGIQFRLWDSPTGTGVTNLIWAQQQNVAVQANGIFNVILGSAGGSPIPGVTTRVTDIGVAFTESSRFLGVTVASQNGLPVLGASEILPRQQLLSVPYAVQTALAAQAATAAVAQSLTPNAADALVPPGTVIAWMGAGTNAPAGWELCWGQEVPRTDPKYARLFSTIGTSSGAGNGNTTFNLPDLRGMFLRGVNGSQTNTNYADPDAALRTNVFFGGNVGNAVGSVQKDDLLSHKHSVSLRIEAAGGGGFPNFLRNGGSVGAVSFDSSSFGGSETRPKNVYVHYLIKL